VKVAGFGDMCAVCYSPLAREGRFEADVEDCKRELFTTTCSHVFHKCCLVRCREADFSTCPMCRAALPAGLTPEHVREKRAARAVLDAANAQQNAIRGAAARAREAVRAQYVRRMINRPLPPAPSVPPAISEEEGGPPEGGAPRSPRPSMGPTSAPATPARGVPVMRGGSGGGSGGGGLSLDGGDERGISLGSGRQLSYAQPIIGGGSETPTPGPGERGGSSAFPSPFVTAAEELRARAAASAVAVSAAYSTASAPSTPARPADPRVSASSAAGVGTVSSLTHSGMGSIGSARLRRRLETPEGDDMSGMPRRLEAATGEEGQGDLPRQEVAARWREREGEGSTSRRLEAAQGEEGGAGVGRPMPSAGVGGDEGEGEGEGARPRRSLARGAEDDEGQGSRPRRLEAAGVGESEHALAGERIVRESEQRATLGAVAAALRGSELHEAVVNGTSDDGGDGGGGGNGGGGVGSSSQSQRRRGVKNIAAVNAPSGGESELGTERELGTGCTSTDSVARKPTNLSDAAATAAAAATTAPDWPRGADLAAAVQSDASAAAAMTATLVANGWEFTWDSGLLLGFLG